LALQSYEIPLHLLSRLIAFGYLEAHLVRRKISTGPGRPAFTTLSTSQVP
jgi:hypothetical protein